MIEFCKRCLYSNMHPLGIIFNEKGICSGCVVHEEKYVINWFERFEKLTEIVDDFKSHNKNNYDCIVPVTGAGDSFFTVHVVKNILGLNPLLVHYNSQFNTSVGIRNLARLRAQFNCDIFIKTRNPKIVKKVSRKTLREFGSIYWHVLAGRTAFPVQVACQYKIPLVILGAHQGVDQVGMFSHFDEVEMTGLYRHQHDLFGVEAHNLVDSFDSISENELSGFTYPSNNEIASVGIKGIYLNNYLMWDSKQQHEQMLKLYGYETAYQTRTFDSYNNIDCWNYSDLHDYIKYLKHGYGKVVDHASREIRLGRITRNKGIALVKKFNHLKPRYAKLYFDWLGITQNSFDYVINQYRSSAFWPKDEVFQFPSESIYYKNLALSQSEVSNKSSGKINFKLTKKHSSQDSDLNYILIGKGN